MTIHVLKQWSESYSLTVETLDFLDLGFYD
jgi:hypothetical protein